MDLALLGILAAGAAGGLLHWRREDRPRIAWWVSAAVAGLVAGGLALRFPAAAPQAGGLLAGAGLAWWRPASRRARGEWVWLAVAAAAAGAAAALVGLAALGALAGGGGAAMLLRERQAGRLAAPALPARRVRPHRVHVLVCVDRPCWDRGADALWPALRQDARFRIGAGVRVTAAGCLGRCGDGPICWLEPAGTWRTHVETGTRDDLLATPIEREGPA